MTDILSLVETEGKWWAEQKSAADAEPDRSRILGQIVDFEHTKYGVSVGWGEFQSEGKAAFWESEGSTLSEALESCPSDVTLKPGWWLFDGFNAHYSVDYWGEHDADYDVDDIRPAVWADILHFMPESVPWWVRILFPIVRSRPVPATFVEYQP